MERHQTIRAYSAGGVVFRLVPLRLSTMPTLSTSSHAPSPEQPRAGEKQSIDELNGVEVAHEGIQGISRNELHDRRDQSGPYGISDRDEVAQVMEVVLVGRSHAGIWALPKGTPEPGETIEQVAVREVQEETGLQVRIIAYIGNISYTFMRTQVRYHKQVRHFLMEPIGGDMALHDHEYDLVAWFPLAEACRRLTYQNEVHILYQAEETLQRWLQYRRREG